MASTATTRRVRSAPPRPRVSRLALTEPDLLLFAAIERHGPLPTSYLYAFTRHLRRDRTHLQNRLTEFYNGDYGGQYLTRPPQQFASYRGRYQHLVYDLAPRARRVLAEQGLLTSYGQARSDTFVHRLMAACIGASFELTAPEHGLRFISCQDILDHPRCGPARASRAPLALPSGHASVVPDLLFGLHYPDAGFRFFAVEAGRNTESIERRNLTQSAFARKITGYVSALQEQQHRIWWGVPNLHVLTVTTSVLHAGNLLRYIRDHVPAELQQRFALMVQPSFGALWAVPQEPLAGVLCNPWSTPLGAKRLCTA
jgi:hypothetical protein